MEWWIWFAWWLIGYFKHSLLFWIHYLKTWKVVDQDKEEDVPKLVSVKVVLVHFNLVNNNHQQASKALFTFVPSKQFEKLITIAPHSLAMLNTASTEFSSIEAWFTDQNCKPFEIEDNADMALIIG